MTAKRKQEANGQAKPRKLSSTRKPEDMTTEQWQAALRRQFGKEQHLELENVGNHLIFSEFAVTNPESGRPPARVRIQLIRTASHGAAPGIARIAPFGALKLQRPHQRSVTSETKRSTFFLPAFALR